MTDRRVWWVAGAVALYAAWRAWPGLGASSSPAGISATDLAVAAARMAPRPTGIAAISPYPVVIGSSSSTTIAPTTIAPTPAAPGGSPAALNASPAAPIYAPATSVPIPAEAAVQAQGWPTGAPVDTAYVIQPGDAAPFTGGMVGFTDPAPSPFIISDSPAPQPAPSVIDTGFIDPGDSGPPMI